MAHERRATVAVTAYKSDYRRPQSRSLSIIIEQLSGNAELCVEIADTPSVLGTNLIHEEKMQYFTAGFWKYAEIRGKFAAWEREIHGWKFHPISAFTNVVN